MGVRRESHPTRRAIAQFALSGLIALLLFAVIAGVVLRRQGREEAVRESRVLGQTLARGVVQPALDDGLLRGERGAIERLDAATRAGILGPTVVRVKLWSADGTIVYSDEPRLIGRVYPLERSELETLRQGGVEAEISDLSHPENVYEASYGKLLEVYLPVHTPGGVPLLFETYQPLSSVSKQGNRIWRTFAPAAIGSLLLLWLAQLPLAASLARHLREGRREREALLEQVVEASEQERLRIAADLHDGVVQDLAGVALSLAVEAEGLAPDNDLHAGLKDAAATTRSAMRRLRSLIVEIYPPNLESVGLAPALADLVSQLERRGVEVAVSIPDARLPAQTEAVFYRTAQEALRNVHRHANAARVEVRVERDAGLDRLIVDDDGIGIPASADAGEGHVGIRIMSDTSRAAGGRFRIEPRDSGGTRVTVEVPST
jgi:signal transduction histidine kinase